MASAKSAHLHHKPHSIHCSITCSSLQSLVVRIFIILTFCGGTLSQSETPLKYINFQENVPAPAIIGSVALDEGSQGVDYIILNGDEPVSALPGNPQLDSLFDFEAGGTVIAKTTFDREAGNGAGASYKVLVFASDRNEPYFVEIVIRDLNDNAPTFQNSNRSISISENTQINDRIATLGSAQDPDEGINSTQRYEIHSGPTGMFKLEETQVGLSHPMKCACLHMYGFSKILPRFYSPKIDQAKWHFEIH